MRIVLVILAFLVLLAGVVWFPLCMVYYAWLSATPLDAAAQDRVQIYFYASSVLFLADIAALSLLIITRFTRRPIPRPGFPVIHH